MRKPLTATAAATAGDPPAVGRGDAPTQLVCLALALALVALATRIAAVW